MSCAKVNCNSKNVSATLRNRCCGKKRIIPPPKPSILSPITPAPRGITPAREGITPAKRKPKDPSASDIFACGDTSVVDKFFGFITGDKKVHECAAKFDKQFAKETNIPNVRNPDPGGGDDDDGGGDGGGGGGGDTCLGILPMECGSLAVIGGAIVLLIIVMKVL